MDLINLLKEKIILLDGAMGTELQKKGESGNCLCNLTAPNQVIKIHSDYLESGSQAIITNTLTMNRIYIKTHGIKTDIIDVNRAGVELAKLAAGDSKLVLGNLSSTGQLLEPYGDYKEDEFYDVFREQAMILAESGVDGFIIETMYDLREVVCAISACKSLGSLPVIASIAFSIDKNGARTMMGNSAEECGKVLTDIGADVIGANCGVIDPFQMAHVVAILRSVTNLPIMAEPNAGKPELLNKRTVFNMKPMEFALGVEECIKAGASIVGGCCGTTPEHIKAVSEILNKNVV